LQNIMNIAEKLAIKADEIACIVYRNDDLGIGGRRFKHIDIELIYGEWIELVESDTLYQELYGQGTVADSENVKEVILFQKEADK